MPSLGLPDASWDSAVIVTFNLSLIRRPVLFDRAKYNSPVIRSPSTVTPPASRPARHRLLPTIVGERPSHAGHRGRALTRNTEQIGYFDLEIRTRRFHWPPVPGRCRPRPIPRANHRRTSPCHTRQERTAQPATRAEQPFLSWPFRRACLIPSTQRKLAMIAH